MGNGGVLPIRENPTASEKVPRGGVKLGFSIPGLNNTCPPSMGIRATHDPVSARDPMRACQSDGRVRCTSQPSYHGYRDTSNRPNPGNRFSFEMRWVSYVLENTFPFVIAAASHHWLPKNDSSLHYQGERQRLHPDWHAPEPERAQGASRLVRTCPHQPSSALSWRQMAAGQPC